MKREMNGIGDALVDEDDVESLTQSKSFPSYQNADFILPPLQSPRSETDDHMLGTCLTHLAFHISIMSSFMKEHPYDLFDLFDYEILNANVEVTIAEGKTSKAHGNASITSHNGRRDVSGFK
uniref:AlNc14C201G8707 protein n=1 Tax=Albugo laibachii Nc14 TaxID=890382 RepID=F0WQP7_9STRA|nr:AlNc14C201G8707 [Albugo laibachii Nc14]|eukprot:CCA23656.1 AlNc14C201G8707 [Albugo laibachii Nc14]